MLRLRALDPATEQELFREAFEWRSRPKRHTRINRMSFEQFSADAPNQVVIGMFHEQLIAVYMFIEVSPKVWEAHFTSRRDADVAQVFAGARTMVDWFHCQGAVVTAEIVARNRPLRAFVEALGFTTELVGQNNTCQNGTGVGRIATVKYQSRWMDNHDQPARHPDSDGSQPLRPT